MAPDRLAVGAPETAERPAWELLVRVPFTLAEMDQALSPVALAQTMIQIGGQPALVRSQRRSVPFFAVGVIDGYKRRLATHRQSHVPGHEVSVDILAELIDGAPFFFAIRLCNPGCLPDTRDRHFVRELHLALVNGTGNRSGGSWLRRAGEWQMALSGKQPGRRVETDPAGTRQVHFSPGVQIGEILYRSRRTVKGFNVRGELNQIAGDKSRSKSEVTQELNEEPTRVSARARPFGQGLLRRLYARFHADQIFDVAGELTVELDKERDTAHLLSGNCSQVTREERGQRFLTKVRRQFYSLPRFVFEGIVLGMRFEEEIERVDDRHLGHEVDFDAKI